MNVVDVAEQDPAGDSRAVGGDGRQPWNPLARIAFRFCFAYFLLFCLTAAQLVYAFVGVVRQSLPFDAVLFQVRALAPITEWVGRHVFGVDASFSKNGSGDQPAIWVTIFMLVVVAAAITLVWTVLDRRRTEYVALGGWFVLVVRMFLGGQMLWYGFAKAIPTQMPEPSLTTLLTPVGDLNLLGLLWNQVGASPVYEVLLGLAEVLGGVLLFLPRTATAGALLSVVSLAQVFVLNMTFNVPVKILSFHLMLLSMVVLAPQARRLADFLVLERVSEPARQPRLFRSARGNRLAAAAQVVLGIWVLAGCVGEARAAWYEIGPGVEKPALYGIWNVTEFDLDGQPVPALATDETRWKRLVFDALETTYQRMDDTLVPIRAETDAAAHRIVLTEAPQASDAAPTELATLTYDRPRPDRLILTGALGGRPVTVALQQQDLDRMPLRTDRFHWVQRAPSDH
ncbi:DoxX family protein [Nocardia mexicana]|uniref:DoxX-like protein n=1 Tax=Nocardia mexicana TaxID=279262 RepID=A0A370H329_9NOCA|nr:DoxX family protein [Nocardia mexicana]RDI50616.1 hypothetical protein DFR68_10593 [Nocardia mexicana]